MIVENIKATTDITLFHVAGETANAQYVLLRNISHTGTQSASNNISSIMIGNYSNYTPYGPRYVVVYNSDIREIGTLASDAGGISFVWNAQDIWVLNSTIQSVGADSIAGCHTCNTDGYQPHRIFIGGNTLGTNGDKKSGENCIDHKGVHDLIISTNICVGPFYREQGWGIVLHDSEATSHPIIENAWVIFNKFYYVSSGVGVVSDGSNNAYVIGNLFYDIGRTYCAEVCSDGWSDNGVFANALNGDFWVIDNTFYNYDTGVKILPTLTSGNNVKILGNIFSSRADSSGYEISLDDNNFTYASVDRNLFYHSSASAFRWSNANKTYSDLVAASQCQNCINGSDPLFTSADTRIFTLQESSPAIGANTENPSGDSVYDKFTSVWASLEYSGLSIKKDFAGYSRPQGGSWDIGAYEYQSSGSAIRKLNNINAIGVRFN